MHTYGYYGFSNISWIPHCLHDWFQLELALFPDSGPYVDTRVRIETLFAGESLVSRWYSQLIIDLNLWRLFPLPWLMSDEYMYALCTVCNVMCSDVMRCNVKWCMYILYMHQSHIQACIGECPIHGCSVIQVLQTFLRVSPHVCCHFRCGARVVMTCFRPRPGPIKIPSHIQSIQWLGGS